MAVIVYANNTLLPYQVQLPNNTVLGQQTAVQVQKISGLRDLAPLRVNDAPKGQMDGAYPGYSLLGGRAITIDWLIAKPSGTTEAAIQSLTAGWQNVTDPSTVVLRAGDYLRQFAGVGTTLPVYMLQIMLPGRSNPLVSFGRPSKLSAPVDLNYQYGWVGITTEWSSPEAVVYDGTVVTGTCGLPNPTSGLTFPTTPNFAFGASSGGSFTLNNTGNYRTTPFFTIQGPCQNPQITNPSTGQIIKINASLGASDTISIDTQNGAVTLNGTANRNTWVEPTSTLFFTLPPGATTLQFSSTDSGQVAGKLNGYLMPAYSTV